MFSWKISFNTFIVALVSLSITIGFTEGITSPKLKVKLKHGGELIGRHLTSHYGRNVRGFIGIPYAKAPLGELRLRAPEPYGAWNGTRMAITDTPQCMQVNPIWRKTDPESSEDCLYLNVYTPEKPLTNKLLPVMVWIHGGFFERGAMKYFNPSYLMDRDVVYVAMNYRLGVLGFLSTETLECPGNFGLKDQTMALRWVQENIEAFGGDPTLVTVFGQSAGSGAVALHTFSELSKGLFHRAIAESGGFYDPWCVPPPHGVHSSKANMLAQMMNCDTSSGNWTNVIDCLRGKPASDLTETLFKFAASSYQTLEIFPPVLEPTHPQAFLTESPRVTPYSNSMPVMIGYNREEGLFAVIDKLNDTYFKNNIREQMPLTFNYNDKTPSQIEYITNTILEYYLKDGPNFSFQNYTNVTNMVTDKMFLTGFSEYIIHRLNGNSPTYAYTFDNKGFASYAEYYSNSEQFMGTCHGDELVYLFPMAEFPTSSPTERDIKLRELMLDLWYNFATYGNPTPPGSYLPTWTPVKSYPPKLMHIGNRSKKGKLLQMSNAFPAERVEFWKKLNTQTDQMRHVY